MLKSVYKNLEKEIKTINWDLINPVSDSIAEKLLEPYINDALYLKTAKENYPFLKGYFNIEHSVYTKKEIDSGHLNLVDLFLCLNQLSYVSFANIFQDQKLSKLQMSLNEFQKLQMQVFIYTVNDLRFRKPITNVNNFEGNMKLGKGKLLNNTYFVNSLFDFEYGSCIGEIGLAIKLN